MMTVHYWIFQPEAWVLAGLLLMALELFDGNMIALPLGGAALVVAALIFTQEQMWLGDTILFSTWRQVLMAFAGIAIVMVGAIRFVFQRRRKTETEDINDY